MNPNMTLGDALRLIDFDGLGWWGQVAVSVYMMLIAVLGNKSVLGGAWSAGKAFLAWRAARREAAEARQAAAVRAQVRAALAVELGGTSDPGDSMDHVARMAAAGRGR